MAIFIPGTICPLCGRPIQKDDDPVLFPAFVANCLDPLVLFHDAVVHRVCLDSHSLGREATRRSQEVIARCGPGERKCVVCGKEITDPDDFFGTGYLAPEYSPIGDFNYLHLHRSHFIDWSRASEFRDKMSAFLASTEWEGPSIVFDPLPMFVSSQRAAP